MSSLDKNLRAVILAGGNGTRLRPLTQRISGDARPKQFCPLLGEATFLTRTRRRVELVISPERTLIVVSRPHRRYYAPLLADAPPDSVLVQPDEHGTGAGILLPLLRISVVEPLAMVALFPSDHYISDDSAFMGYVLAGADAVAARPDLLVLLGVRPTDPDPGYGWIEPGPPLASPIGSPLYRVSQFWEKPSPGEARRLYDRNCLWNSFVVVGQVRTFLALIR
jgi:mannose-1-phosphate guanylyltransferase